MPARWLAARPQPKTVPIWIAEIHGLAALWTRMFWSAVIGCCFTSALYFSHVLFNAYLVQHSLTLNSFEEVNRIKYPHIVFCPKQADSLNYSAIRLDMANRLDNLTDEDFHKLLNVAIGASGIHGLSRHLSGWSLEEWDRVYNRFEQWKDNRTLSDFFQMIFVENGYRCEDLFARCYYGFNELNCCDLFEAVHVLKRGRCFRLKDLHQSDVGDLGRFRVMMNSLPTNFYKINGTQPQIIAYMSTYTGDVNSSPRIYLNPNTWNELQFTLRYIQMFPETSQCYNGPEDKGTEKCANDAWIRQKLLIPFNCTLYAFPIEGVDVCDPWVIIDNYERIMIDHYDIRHCVPACIRYQIRDQYSSRPRELQEPFMASLTYSIETYEERRYTTIPGFISELGGQGMLYLGLSLNSFIQLFLLISQKLGRIFKR